MNIHQTCRKFKTCKKLACMQTMGGGGSEGTRSEASLFTNTYHQRTELIILSHIQIISLIVSLLCALLKFSNCGPLLTIAWMDGLS